MSCINESNVAPSLDLSFSGLQLCMVSSSPATEVTRIVERESANGLSSSQVR